MYCVAVPSFCRDACDLFRFIVRLVLGWSWYCCLWCGVVVVPGCCIGGGGGGGGGGTLKLGGGVTYSCDSAPVFLSQYCT